MTIKRSTLVMLAVVAVATVLVSLAFPRASILKSLTAAVVIVVVIRMGFTMIRGLAEPVPEPPESGTLRKVKLTYRCSICGAEVKMTAAPSEDPEPPRHCLEDMDLVAPVIE